MMNVQRIGDFTLIQEAYPSAEGLIKNTTVQDEVYAVVAYTSGSSFVESTSGSEIKSAGRVYSFYANPEAGTFRHELEAGTILKKTSLMIPFSTLKESFSGEDTGISGLLHESTSSKAYKRGNSYRINPEIHRIVEGFQNSNYSGILRKIHFESRCLAWLAEHVNQSQRSLKNSTNLSHTDIAKLYEARRIVLESLNAPLTLKQLSRTVNLNIFKLKTGFTEVFGTSVFKFMHTERMNLAYTLLCEEKLAVKEVSQRVGYEEISSFSNAFLKIFHFRPSSLNSGK